MQTTPQHPPQRQSLGLRPLLPIPRLLAPLPPTPRRSQLPIPLLRPPHRQLPYHHPEIRHHVAQSPPIRRRQPPPPPPTRPPLTTQNPHLLVPFLELKLYSDNQKTPDLSAFSTPRLFASHLPTNSLPNSILDSNSKIVYLCRNPRDTFISLWHFANRLRNPKDGFLPLEEAFESFCRGVSLYGPFWDHVLGYWKESLERPSSVMFLKYEQLKAEPLVCVKRLAEFLGCPFSPQEEEEGVVDGILRLCSFESLSNLEVNRNGKLDSGEECNAFFRRGEVGDSKNYLTPEMVERLDRISEEKLRGSGLKFEI